MSRRWVSQRQANTCAYPTCCVRWNRRSDEQTNSVGDFGGVTHARCRLQRDSAWRCLSSAGLDFVSKRRRVLSHYLRGGEMTNPVGSPSPAEQVRALKYSGED